MFLIKPQPVVKIDCPKCKNAKLNITNPELKGIYFAAKGHCTECNSAYCFTLPTGHALYYPAFIDIKTDELFSVNSINLKWYYRQVYKGFKTQLPENVNVEIIKYTEQKEVIILNCLDYLYGHVLLKLLNASQYLIENPNLGLIVIIPRNFSWLIPKGLAEAWIVDLPLSAYKNWYTGLTDFFNEQLTRFKSVYLGLAFSHPNIEKIKIEDYTGIKPYKEKSTIKKPTISFIIREDRLWLGNKLLDKIDVVCNHFKIKLLKNLLVSIQKHRIERLHKQLQSKNPNIEFRLIGVGKSKTFSKNILDYRTEKPNADWERKACALYAESEIVIGIHGSNMLLPTAHAASFIELMPADRFGNFIQDIMLPYSGRKFGYFGRFISDKSSIKELSHLVSELLRSFSFYNKLMDDKYLYYQNISDLSKWQMAEIERVNHSF